MEYPILPYETYKAEEIEPLYQSVGWTSYLRRPGLLREAYAASLKILAAWDEHRLIGVARAVGDGASILYVQDLLVHPEYQGKGVGSSLLKQMLACYPDVNQALLLTDDTENTVRFYENAGFQKVAKAGCCAFIRLNDYYGG